MDPVVVAVDYYTIAKQKGLELSDIAAARAGSVLFWRRRRRRVATRGVACGSSAAFAAAEQQMQLFEFSGPEVGANLTSPSSLLSAADRTLALGADERPITSFSAAADGRVGTQLAADFEDDNDKATISVALAN